MKNLLKFLQLAMKLKDIKRTGWIYKNIQNPESVADHSFGVTLISMIIPLPSDVRRDKLIKMAIVHDLGEVKIGDLVWETGNYSNIKKHTDKKEKEINAMKELSKLLNNDEIKELGIEFIKQETKTAKFLKEIDKIEMILQALEYEKKVHPSKLDEFWENAEKYIKDEKIKEFFIELKKQRD